MRVSDAAAICGGRLLGDNSADSQIARIVIDSREVRPGDMFAAYKGEKTDGHAYIQTALDKGAACCLAERIPADVSGAVILVPDTQTALEELSAANRETLNLPIIGITGSVGKTSAKEMIWSVLSQRLNVLKTEGNLNNQLGVPMTLSRITQEHQAAVVEMGISDFGEMRRLTYMAKPDIAVFTVIGHAHLEFLHDLEGVFKAKTEMLEGMDEKGIVIINGDDPWLRTLKCRQRLLSCGLGGHCDIRAESIRLLPDCHTGCDIIYGDRRIAANIPAYGRHMVYAALEGAAVGFVMGLEDSEIEAGIAAFEIIGRRGAVRETGFITLVDDSYNANPDSMESAITSLVQLPGRHVCILADMLEMGEDTERMHLEVGAFAAKQGVDLVIGCGRLGSYIARGAGEIGRSYSSREAVTEDLPSLIMKGDAVLVKASRGMHMEEIAEALKLLKDE